MNDKDAEKPTEDVEYIPETKETSGEEKKAKDTAKEEASEANGLAKMPESEESHHIKSKLKKRDTEIKHLKKEKDELKDRYLRTLAEMENLKKRQEREKGEYTQYALSEMLQELLEVLDNFEKALNVADQGADGKTFREGIELIYRLYQNILIKNGVRPIEIKGNKFDPNLHHAMSMEESDQVSEPELGQELRKGYMLHNRLLRPTLVKVIVPKKS